MSGVVKIEIRETEEELKALLGREKDAHRHEKLHQSLNPGLEQTD